MEADWSVELGADDPALEMPWSSPDGALRWQDLRRGPELIRKLSECNTHPEFIEPLRTLNSPESRVLTAKCDAFAPELTEPAEELFGCWRMVSYIDLLFAPSTPSRSENDFSPSASNFGFALHERFARDFCARIDNGPESAAINATVELVVRRCAYNSSSSDSRDGFYFTLYVVGYGESAEEARGQWGTALRVCGKLLAQMR
jgi:hypothetical protein